MVRTQDKIEKVLLALHLVGNTCNLFWTT